LGGNWNESSNSGSRCSNWNNSPTNSNNNIGVRGACDDIFLFQLCHDELGRLHKQMVVSQFHPSSENTNSGSVQRLVANPKTRLTIFHAKKRKKFNRKNIIN
jgi:hypothetical protein